MPPPAVVTKKIYQLPHLAAADIADDDLVYIYDSSAGILKHTEVSNIGGIGGGGGGGGTLPPGSYTLLGSPFKIFPDDDAYSYNSGTDTITISDIRLIGRLAYPVFCTQINGEFREENLTYDDVAGTVEITGLGGLADGEHITISTDGVPNDSIANYISTLQGRITLLEQIAKPFMSYVPTGGGSSVTGGGIIAWFRSAADIPVGWQEWTPGRGRFLIGNSGPGGDADFATNESSGGNKMHTNTIEEMAPHYHGYYRIPDGNDRFSKTIGSGHSHHDAVPTHTNTEYAGGVRDSIFLPPHAEPWNIMNPYRVVNWIQFVGV